MATEKRLTEKHYSGNGYYMKCSGLCHFDGHCADCDELVKIVDRLGEYEDKAKQTVDAVEVVRCKDCQSWHKQTKTCDEFTTGRLPSGGRIAFVTSPNDYCSFAKRKTGGADNGL